MTDDALTEARARALLDAANALLKATPPNRVNLMRKGGAVMCRIVPEGEWWALWKAVAWREALEAESDTRHETGQEETRCTPTG